MKKIQNFSSSTSRFSQFSLLNKLCLAITFLAFSSISAKAKEPKVYPTPQKISSLGPAIKLKKGVLRWAGKNKADQLAVSLVQKVLANSNIKVIIGEANDPGMQSFDKVPQNKEGYYLKVTPKAIIIVGRDEIGTYYGAQTLRQLVKNSKKGKQLSQVEVIDYPDVPFRGTVEGFYGKPWGFVGRASQIKFYGKYKLNTYIYGPKDDPFHGFSNRWREPYPADKAEEMKKLVTIAKENKVNFIWAVHPGANIFWTDKDGDGIIDDFVNCLKKFEMMYQLGVRSFAVFFDDIGGEGAKPEMQAKILNYLNREFVRKKGDVTPLLMCPTQYNRAWSGGPYLNILGTKMDKDIDIMWTGDSVCRDITRSGQDWINEKIKRKAYIWWNWPVSDYCRTRLLIGRTYGLDKNNKGTYSGFTSNPMDKPEASKIGLFGVADYTWNIEAFDSHQAWKDGIKRLFPTIAREVQLFANHNSDQGKNYHGYRREESVEFQPTIDLALQEFNSTGQVTQTTFDKLTREFKYIEKSAQVILKKMPAINAAMHDEVEHWLEAFEYLGKAGTATSRLIGPKKISPSQKLKLINYINHCFNEMQAASLRQVEKGKPDRWARGCTVGARNVLPFLEKIFADSSRAIYKELTGKELAKSTGKLFKFLTNVDKLKTIEAERKGKTVKTKRILEVIKLQPNDYVGLELPPGIFATYVHLKLNNEQAGKLGEVQISKDAKQWKKINAGQGKELRSGINAKEKYRFMRYINKSNQAIEIKLNQFKLDIPANAKANSFGAMFDGNFTTYFTPSNEQSSIKPPKGSKAKQVFIVGSLENVSVVYKNGKTVPYKKAQKIKSPIRMLQVKTGENVRINEIIWK